MSVRWLVPSALARRRRLRSLLPCWPAWSTAAASSRPPGCARRFRPGHTTGRDQLLEVVPGRRIGYISLSSLPVRDYRATVDFAGDHLGRAA
jgi:hypothetical protein